MNSFYKVVFVGGAIFSFLIGCAKESNSASSSCATQKATHQGCCSSHGGFGNQCADGEALYAGDGSLICNDGSESPTCVRGKHFQELLNEYLYENGLEDVRSSSDGRVDW